MEKRPYNPTSQKSILEYTCGLIGKSLRELVDEVELKSRSGKGGLGQLVEELYFGYTINSNPEADFTQANVELKCTGLKQQKDQSYQIKERLVCNMIDYVTLIDESFRESSFFRKCAVMLIIFYLYQKGIDLLDIKFIYSILWKIPEKDLMMMEQDYNLIVEKVKNGLAHELSEGDTYYLAACRKGNKDSKPRKQPCSEILALPRAFSLKPSYMRTILQFIQESNQSVLTNDETIELNQGVTTIEELKIANFEEILKQRFQPFIHCTYEDICAKLNIPESRAKHKFYIITKLIAQGGSTVDFTKSDEFRKAGIILKTIRIQKSGVIKEAMSFEQIDYDEVLMNDDWVDSRLYEIFTSRFMFVLFQERDNGQYELAGVKFWTMPSADLDKAEKYWENIRENVKANTIDLRTGTFYKISDNKDFHVRPKARNSADVTTNPNGGTAPKYCYWFNTDYVKKILNLL